jgi:hypothetical protein
MDRTLLFKVLILSQNQYKDTKDELSINFSKIFRIPFYKNVRQNLLVLYSITEDYFEQDVNSVFVKIVNLLKMVKRLVY